MTTPSFLPASDGVGIIAQEEAAAATVIREAAIAAGADPGARPIDLRPLPFAGTWGSASTIARMLASGLVQRDLEAEGALEGLSKKQVKKLVSEQVSVRAQMLAEQMAERIRAEGRFATVEAVNGYINITYDAALVARQLLGEVLEQGEGYGHAPEGSHPGRVMIEHSQLNTHKAAHVGHLRNICLGVAVTNIVEAAGFSTMPVTYIGDIGRHVVQCLWCYERFHAGEEPSSTSSRGRWLGDIYVESSARLSYRKDLLGFLFQLVKEDLDFVEAIDRMLKQLWEVHNEGEDIAYLLGCVINGNEIDPSRFIDDEVIVKFWPIVGEQLMAERDGPVVDSDDADGDGAEVSKPSMTPDERVEEWVRLNTHLDWWPHVSQWEQEVRATFQRWETKDPDFVSLWEMTREWSMIELREIFEEFGATFEEWFSESGVEDAGREIVKDLLEAGIAEISEGLPVVKIDERLGLEQDTYRTMPILRSDGTTLYSTKDLALTRMKFVDYKVDTAVWVVDVRQSLYFDQISKILEISGFEQAGNTVHLGYEFVAMPSGAISSRKGNAPMLEDVRTAVLERARAIIEEKNPKMDAETRRKVAWQVGIGAIKYTMLARDSNKVIVFDPEEALSFDGHAAPYVQYAHARACRILEHAGFSEAEARAGVDSIELTVHTPEELSLLQTLSELPAVVQRAAAEYRPLYLTNYVYELAKTFNDFYHACPVLKSEDPVKTARLTLVAATRVTLRNGLNLLGIEAPDEM
jgi:arginyl-tRNA synthetase